MNWRVGALVAVSVLTVACTQETQNKFGRAI